MRELPKGWAIAKLTEICHIEMGQSPPSSSYTYKDQGRGIPFLQGKGEFGALYPTPIKYCLRPSKIAPKGAVLLSVRAPVGPTNITLNECCIGRGLAAISPYRNIPVRFILWALRKHAPALAKLGTGSTFSAISKTQVTSIPITLPPLNEQRRIVAKIEAMFDQIDKSVESLKTARATLGLYRQSLLKSAFEGHLTADWRAQNSQKLEDAETLLSRIKAEREAHYKTTLNNWEKAVKKWTENGQNGKRPVKPKRPRAIPTKVKQIKIRSWRVVPLGLVIDEPAYGTSKKSNYNGGEKGVLRIPNIANGVIDTADLKSADFDSTEIEQYQLLEGDILTIRSNGSLSLVGRPALVRSVDTRFIYAGYLIRLRPIHKSLIPKNLIYLMIEPNVRSQIERKAKSTSGVNNINAKELQELQIPICSPAEQAEIVRLLDQRFDAANALEAEIDTALTRAETLRQSILKKAFTGQLVPQDPNDESAAVLLQRIHAERTKPQKNTRKTRRSA